VAKFHNRMRHAVQYYVFMYFNLCTSR
jgi:hypothetical protein